MKSGIPVFLTSTTLIKRKKGPQCKLGSDQKKKGKMNAKEKLMFNLNPKHTIHGNNSTENHLTFYIRIVRIIVKVTTAVFNTSLGHM